MYSNKVHANESNMPKRLGSEKRDDPNTIQILIFL